MTEETQMAGRHILNLLRTKEQTRSDQGCLWNGRGRECGTVGRHSGGGCFRYKMGQQAARVLSTESKTLHTGAAGWLSSLEHEL